MVTHREPGNGRTGKSSKEVFHEIVAMDHIGFRDFVREPRTADAGESAPRAP